MGFTPTPLSIVDGILEPPLGPEGELEAAAGRRVSPFASLAPQRKVPLSIQDLAHCLIQLPFPHNLMGGGQSNKLEANSPPRQSQVSCDTLDFCNAFCASMHNMSSHSLHQTVQISPVWYQWDFKRCQRCLAPVCRVPLSTSMMSSVLLY